MALAPRRPPDGTGPAPGGATKRRSPDMTDTLLDPITTRAPERLAALGSHGRLAAYEEGELGAEELYAWAALYPKEVPLVNGELPWIALTLE
jgi:hypothetical protein